VPGLDDTMLVGNLEGNYKVLIEGTPRLFGRDRKCRREISSLERIGSWIQKKR